MDLSLERLKPVRESFPAPKDWHYLDQGRGPAVLLLHGLGASSFSWRHNIGILSRHFRVVAPDVPPHGQSPAPLTADYSPEALTRGIIDFLDFLGLDQAALVGNSLGGGLALLLAGEYPKRFPALALLAPAIAMVRLPRFINAIRMPHLDHFIAALLGPWIIPLALRQAFYNKNLITGEVIKGYAAPFRDFSRRLAIARLSMQLDPYPLGLVETFCRRICQPVSLIWGQKDRVLRVSQAYWLHVRLHNSHLHVLPMVGHAPQEEAPDTVNKLIIDFLTHSLKN